MIDTYTEQLSNQESKHEDSLLIRKLSLLMSSFGLVLFITESFTSLFLPAFHHDVALFPGLSFTYIILTLGCLVSGIVNFRFNRYLLLGVIIISSIFSVNAAPTSLIGNGLIFIATVVSYRFQLFTGQISRLIITAVILVAISYSYTVSINVTEDPKSAIVTFIYILFLIIIIWSMMSSEIEKYNKILTQRDYINNELSNGIVEQKSEVESINTILKQVILDKTDDEAKIKRLTNMLEQKKDDDKKHIADYLHDHLGQTLSMSLILLGSLDVPKESKELIEKAKNLIEETRTKTRSLMRNLYDPQLLSKGITPAVEGISQYVKEHFKLHVILTIEDNEPKIDEALGMFICDSIRELLTNVAKHAGTETAECHINWNPIKIRIKDKGLGFPPEMLKNLPSEDGGFGIFRLQQKAVSFGGNMDIYSSEGQGTEIIIRI